MTSKKKNSNNKKTRNDSLYLAQDSKNTETPRKRRLEHFKNLELERHWDEIFKSPEFEQDLDADDFRDDTNSNLKKSLSKNKEIVLSSLLTGTFENKLKIIREAIQEIDR